MCNGSDSLHTGAVPKTGIKNFTDSPKKPNSWFQCGRGHHVPAPTWEGCQVTLSLSPVALACACLWLSLVWPALVFLAGVVLALVLLAGLWAWGFFFRFPL